MYDSVLALTDSLGVKIDIKSNQDFVKHCMPGTRTNGMNKDFGESEEDVYGCESWTVKKAEHRKIDAFGVWCWRRLFRAPWKPSLRRWFSPS